MKKNFTSINVILDGSGSMGSLVNDTIGGFNQFLQEQQALPGEAILSLCVFNTDVNPVHDNIPLANVPLLDKKTYRASGGTALLDAIGSTIDSVGAKFAAMKEEDRPSKVLFLIVTDGEENSSHLMKEETIKYGSTANGKAPLVGIKKELRYPSKYIKEMVEHQQSKYNWEFVFMGANIDAFGEGASLGIASRNTLQYTPSAAGTKDLYKSISTSTRRFRSGDPSGSGFFGGGTP